MHTDAAGYRSGYCSSAVSAFSYSGVVNIRESVPLRQAMQINQPLYLRVDCKLAIKVFPRLLV